MSTIKTYAIAALALALAFVALAIGILRYGTHRYQLGVQDGRNAVLAADALAAAKAQQHSNDLAASSAAAGAQLQQNLGVQLPTIQEQTHEATETIRTIYRDRPVPIDGCSRPDGVQAQLDAAVARANAAASTAGGLRSDAAAGHDPQGAAANQRR